MNDVIKISNNLKTTVLDIIHDKSMLFITDITMEFHHSLLINYIQIPHDVFKQTLSQKIHLFDGSINHDTGSCAATCCCTLSRVQARAFSGRSRLSVYTFGAYVCVSAGYTWSLFYSCHDVNTVSGDVAS